VRASTLAARGLMCLAVLLSGGCYSYMAAPTRPAPGTRLSIELTDAGRIEMAGHVGPEIDRIEGWLTAYDDSAYILRVERTINLRGGTMPWNGETVLLRTALAARVREKRFSAPRTVVLAGTVTAGFIGFLASRGLLAGGSGSTLGPPGGGTGSQ
jgi:hypothetical protein